MTYTLTASVDRPFDEVLAATRAALADQGFGVLTEIDLAATLKAKLDADIPPQVILGACRPPLALAATRAEPSIGVLLPCNVVVRGRGDGGATLVEAMDPEAMVTVTGNAALQDVATDAGERLRAALATLTRLTGGDGRGIRRSTPAPAPSARPRRRVLQANVKSRRRSPIHTALPQVIGYPGEGSSAVRRTRRTPSVKGPCRPS